MHVSTIQQGDHGTAESCVQPLFHSELPMSIISPNQIRNVSCGIAKDILVLNWVSWQFRDFEEVLQRVIRNWLGRVHLQATSGRSGMRRVSLLTVFIFLNNLFFIKQGTLVIVKLILKPLHFLTICWPRCHWLRFCIYSTYRSRIPLDLKSRFSIIFQCRIFRPWGSKFTEPPFFLFFLFFRMKFMSLSTFFFRVENYETEWMYFRPSCKSKDCEILEARRDHINKKHRDEGFFR